MRVAILGWGSLVWDSRDLPRIGYWQKGGPELPIEFSRISSDGRLTLVIDPDNGLPVPTRFVLSSRTDLDKALSDLAEREGTTSHRIGFVDLGRGSRRSIHPQGANIIERWTKAKGVDAVIWTDLPSNFKKETGDVFTVERALEYLEGLSGDKKMGAREYIENAPPEVETPLRRRLREVSWLGR